MSDEQRSEIIRLTRAQVREIDRLAIERYHIPGIVLMENAARGVADVALEMLSGVESPQVMIFCGGGNNGGDGFAVARHLHNRGVGVEIVANASLAEVRGDALTNLEIARAMGLEFTCVEDADISLRGEPDLVIDALVGTGLSSPPRDRIRLTIEMINEDCKSPILAIDVPSGLDCDTGLPLGACIRATETITFVAQKTGFARPEAAGYLGRVQVADIGCPLELVDEVSKSTPPA